MAATRFALVLVALLVAGCGAGTSLSSPPATASPSAASPSPSPVPSAPLPSPSPASTVEPPAPTSPPASIPPTTVPTTARLACDGTRTTLLDPVIRPQPEGVRFEVRNTSGRHLAFTIVDRGGDNAPVGDTVLVWPLPPGTATVGCEDDLVQLLIVDPTSIYVPAEPDCADGAATVLAIDYVEFAPSLKGDVVAVAKAKLSGLLPDDVVKRVGYPASAVPLVGVVRAGRLAAVTSFAGSASRGWLIDTLTACSDAGIGVKDAG